MLWRFKGKSEPTPQEIWEGFTEELGVTEGEEERSPSGRNGPKTDTETGEFTESQGTAGCPVWLKNNLHVRETRE